MAQHAILRFEKHKGHPAGPLEAHHERKKEQYASNPDIDTSRSKYNFHIPCSVICPLSSNKSLDDISSIKKSASVVIEEIRSCIVSKISHLISLMELPKSRMFVFASWMASFTSLICCCISSKSSHSSLHYAVLL